MKSLLGNADERATSPPPETNHEEPTETVTQRSEVTKEEPQQRMASSTIR